MWTAGSRIALIYFFESLGSFGWIGRGSDPPGPSVFPFILICKIYDLDYLKELLRRCA